MQLVSGDIEARDPPRVRQPDGRRAEAAGGSLANAVKLTVYLTDLAQLRQGQRDHGRPTSRQPYPARAAVGVAQLPRGARVEIECILHLG